MLLSIFVEAAFDPIEPIIHAGESSVHVEMYFT